MEQFKVGDKVRPICEPSRVETIIEITNDVWVTVTDHRHVGHEYWLSSKIEIAPIPKKADDMFAELGWNKEDDLCTDNREWFSYQGSHRSILAFYQDEKQYLCNELVSIEEHKAITKKLEELGWL